MTQTTQMKNEFHRGFHRFHRNASARIRLIATACSLMILAIATMDSAHAQVAGISYTLTPLAEQVFFDRNAGLANGTLVGGRLGFGFGEYTELSGIYLVSTGLSTDFDRFDDLGDESRDAFAALPARDVQARHQGVDLKFNLGSSTIFPFISVGTGILTFDPQNMDRGRVIYLSGAAGLQFSLSDHFGLIVQVRDLAYRYTPSNALLSETDLADLGLQASDFRQVDVHNIAVRVGLQMYAGGRPRGELTDADLALRNQFSRGISGIRLQIEPMGGIIDFQDELGYRERQRVAGALAGIDLGPYLGLRGFYWRGVQEDALTDFDRIQAYGGEVKLSFGTVLGTLIPHLVLGGGYLDVLDDYTGSGTTQPVDRPFAVGGAGLAIPLTNGIRLQGGVRTLLLTTTDVDRLTDPSDVTASFMYSAGISFGLGGGSAVDKPLPPEDRPPLRRDVADAETELDRMQRQIDSLRIAVDTQRQFGPYGVPADRVPADTAIFRRTEPDGPDGPDGRWVTIPVPETGELYVRFGESTASAPYERGAAGIVYVDPQTGRVVEDPSDRTPPQDLQAAPADPGVSSPDAPTGPQGTGATLSADDIRAIVRDVVQNELRASGRERIVVPQTVTSDSERRLLERIAELESRLAVREAETPTVIRSYQVDRAGYELAAVTPIGGLGFSEDRIALAGVRADLRSYSLRGARFLPELVAAIGADGISYELNADAAFPLGFQIRSYRPYAGLGFGLVTAGGAELVFNLLAGVEQAGLYGRFFAEYMSQDFFALNRLVIGYRFSF